MRPKKSKQVVNNFSRKRVGLIVFEAPFNVSKEINSLTKSLKNNYDIDVIAPEGIFDNFEDNVIPDKKHSLLKYFYLLKNTLKYVHYANPSILVNWGSIVVTIPLTFFLGKVFNKYSIARLSGDIFGEYKLFKGPQKIPIFLIRNVMCGLCIRMMDRIIILEPYKKNELLSRGISEAKIELIPPPAFPFASNRHRILTDYKKSISLENSKIILFVGRISRLKGAETLEKVAREVGKKRKDIVFCLVGEGEYKEKIEKLENVIAVGKVEYKEIHKYYGAADLLILPSLTEGLPNVVLEALYYSVPVVASNVGGIPWVVSNTFNPEDWRGFSNYILSMKWKPDKLPELFSEEEIKNKWQNILS